MLNLYLVSDASGETVNTVSTAAAAQFEGIEVIKHMRPLVRTSAQVDEVISSVLSGAPSSSIIVYTMAKGEALDRLLDLCQKHEIACASPIEAITQGMSVVLSMAPNCNNPSKYPLLDESYFSVIDSINFAIQHDDGQNWSNYNEADLVIIGPSRTSKSPTSLYLAKYGYKVANIPLVAHSQISISHITKPLKVGFTISPDLLAYIRQRRCDSIVRPSNSSNSAARDLMNNYSSKEAIREEIAWANQFFAQHHIRVIDVTRKAIEEISAELINIMQSLK